MGTTAARAVVGDRVAERVGTHREPIVDGDSADRIEAEPEQQHRLVDGRVGVLGAVNARPPEIVAHEPALAHLRHRRLAGRGQRVQR
jgi:hypothetical protein